MFKKTMTFDDLDGNEVQQTFYFNYNKKEIAELLEFKQLEEKLRVLNLPVEDSGLTQQENTQQAYDIFQDLILDAFGKKGADNVTFEKNETLRNYWKSHVAFVELIFEFIENPALAAEFIENCLPTKMVAKAKEEMQRENAGRLSSESLAEMVEEAARRQKDPATRIEPGVEAATEALGTNPEVALLATSIAGNTIVDGPIPVRPVVVDDGTEKEKRQEDLTPEEIDSMDETSFLKLDPRRFNPDQMMAAFKRKAQS